MQVRPVEVAPFHLHRTSVVELIHGQALGDPLQGEAPPGTCWALVRVLAHMWALLKGFKDIYQMFTVSGAVLNVLCILSPDTWYEAGAVLRCVQNPRETEVPIAGPPEARPCAYSQDGS